ncbi:seizure 6-like protein isoform X2 [Branchiostoma floridae x Branchiostoma japonicum]
MFLMFLVIVGASAEFRDEVTCPLGTVTLTDPIGHISSPGHYPDSYTNNQHCEWNILAPEGYTVMVKFKSIQLSERPDQQGGHTGPNHVSIYDGDKTEGLLYRWTGKSTVHRPARPDPFISYTNQVFITFDAFLGEDIINLEGFYLDYRILPAGTPHPGECVDYGPIPHGRTFPPHGPYRIRDALRLECASGTAPEPPDTVGDTLECEQEKGRSFPRWTLPTDQLLSDISCKAKCKLDETMAYGALRSPGWPDPDHEEPNEDCRWTIDPQGGYGLRLYFNSTDFRTKDEYIQVNGRNLDCRLHQDDPYPPNRTLETDRQHVYGRVDVQYHGKFIRGSSVEIFFSSDYCGDPGTISHGKRIDSATSPPEDAGKVFQPGDSVTYSCEPGYEMVGPATLICAPGTGTVYKYRWDNYRPSCRRTSWPPCTDPGVPENGSQQRPNGYDVGSTVTFTCNAGFYPSGSQAMTCGPLPDGSSGWSGVQPTCVPAPCEKPSMPAHAQVTVMALSDLGYVAVFECDPGYVMTSGSPVRTCRNGAWDGETPVCEVKVTTPLPTPPEPSTAGPTTTSEPSSTTASPTTTGQTTLGETTSTDTTAGETTEDIFTLSYSSTVASTTPLPTTRVDTTTVETTSITQGTTDVTTTDFTTHPTTDHSSTVPLTSPGTTGASSSSPATTNRHTATTDITTNPTTNQKESTTISKTTRPESTIVTNTAPTVRPASNGTKGPPGKQGRAVNTGAAIGGSVSAVVLVAAVIGGVCYYRKKCRTKEPEIEREWLYAYQQPYYAIPAHRPA